MTGGVLTLVATPIGNLGDVSTRAVDALRAADWIYAEDTRRTRVLLSHCAIPAGRRLRTLHAHNEASQSQQIAELVAGGANVVYVSDAGTPGISDPGERLVRRVVDAGLPVDCIPGASALLMAVVLSGLPTTPFTFFGFLDRKGRGRADALALMAASTHTSVCYESPRRLRATLEELAGHTGAERQVSVARELTKVHQEVRRGTVAEIVAALDAGELRELGEVVLVVAGAAGAAPIDDDVLHRRIDELLDDGRSARDTAAVITGELAVAHRVAYAAVLERRAVRSS